MPLFPTTISHADSQESAESEQSDKLPHLSRLWTLVAVAVGPLITGYAAVAALLALVTSTASQTQFSTLGVLAAAGPGWLAVHQVPLHIDDQPLGLLPLLPGIAVCFLIARTASAAMQRLDSRNPSQAAIVVIVVAGAHAVFGGFIAIVSDRISAHVIVALVLPALLSGVAASVGVVRHSRHLCDGLSRYLEPAAVPGLRAGIFSAMGFLAIGSVVFLVALAFSIPTVHELFVTGAPGLGSGLGMLLLSLVYLPNAVIFSASFATGPGFSLGTLFLNPYHFSSGPVPGVPILAALPQQQAVWWPAILLLPALVGAATGWLLRQIHADPMSRLRLVVIAGALNGFLWVGLSLVAGGQLGNGPIGTVAISAISMSVTAFCWIVIPGGLVAWFAGPRRAEQQAKEEPSVSAEASRDTGPSEDAESLDVSEKETPTEEVGTEMMEETGEALVEENSEAEPKAPTDELSNKESSVDKETTAIAEVAEAVASEEPHLVKESEGEVSSEMKSDGAGEEQATS